MSDMPPAPRPRIALWVAAGACAFVLHAGAIAAMLREPATDEGADLGAPAIEIGIELAAPRQERSDLPPGPESDASTASTASIQQKMTPEETKEKEQATPTETEDPDRLVAEKPPEKPKEEQPVSRQQTDAASESVASEATSAPTVETVREAAVSTAPAIGTGDSARLVRTTWQRSLVAHLDRNKRYPATTNRRATEILVTFTLDRSGKVVTASLMRSSGDAAFDEAALSMVRRADPVPAPPPLVADEGLTFTVPVVFRAKGRG